LNEEHNNQMKQEFQKGDRVLVRDGDLREWIPAVFEEVYSEYYFKVAKNDGIQCVYSQCRHIHDFRTGDKVQVRDSETHEWQPTTYAVHVPRAEFQHWVFAGDMGRLYGYKFCRWHPSTFWADKKQPLTLEQRVEALERKLNDQ
jgi:hypothetical protein